MLFLKYYWILSEVINNVIPESFSNTFSTVFKLKTNFLTCSNAILNWL